MIRDRVKASHIQKEKGKKERKKGRKERRNPHFCMTSPYLFNGI